ADSMVSEAPKLRTRAALDHGPRIALKRWLEKVPMDINRLTEKTQEAVQAAQNEALRRGNQQVDSEHLLLALLTQEGGLAASILKRAGANVETLAARLDQDLERLPNV